MNPPDAAELGHGVTVAPVEGGGFEVSSSVLELGWKARQGSFPGSAIRWRDELYEVIASELGDGAIRRYRLASWREGEAIRTIETLDEQRIAGRSAELDRARRNRGAYTLLAALMPITGLFPRRTQERWQRELNFNAARATTISALSEMFIGGIGLVQSFTAVSREFFLPPALRWLVLVGPIMFAESLIRLRFGVTQGEGLGSLFLWPYNLVERRLHPPPPPAVDRPVVEHEDPDRGELVLRTAGGRSDWTEGGILRFREQRYRLLYREARSAAVLYHFVGVEGELPATLRLQPPPVHDPGRPRTQEIGLLSLWLRSLLMCFAPARFQKSFFPRYGSSPLLMTLITATVECAGGAANLARQSTPGIHNVVDLVLIAEGLLRIVLAFSSSGPVGSLLGLPFLPLYRRWTS